MTFENALSPVPCIPDVRGSRSLRANADLIRRIVHARRGLSRAEVVDWVSQFVNDTDRAEVGARIGGVIDVLCEMKDIGYG
ncbi:MAG: hypothetical protein LC667_17065, partial [Thioalkalivibrio sp.]|nr:hypothetical protein [Thioalkalivibrio sp.]